MHLNTVLASANATGVIQEVEFVDQAVLHQRNIERTVPVLDYVATVCCFSSLGGEIGSPDWRSHT